MRIPYANHPALRVTLSGHFGAVSRIGTVRMSTGGNTVERLSDQRCLQGLE